MTIGGTSDTQDAWGNITYTGITNFNSADLEKAFDYFTGPIEQIPPMYSAVHHDGQRLYELARQGITVHREPRRIHIGSLQLLELSRDQNDLPLIKFRVECSPGTYVRTLCHDIGQHLGTGAFISGLTRIRSGIFTIEESHELDIILNNDLSNYLLPLDYPLGSLAKIQLTSEHEYYSILNGNAILCKYDCSAGISKVYYADNLISIAQCQHKDEKKVIKPLKVLK
jgi:tRNA pseudouridine55 synthase